MIAKTTSFIIHQTINSHNGALPGHSADPRDNKTALGKYIRCTQNPLNTTNCVLAIVSQASVLFTDLVVSEITTISCLLLLLISSVVAPQLASIDASIDFFVVSRKPTRVSKQLFHNYYGAKTWHRFGRKTS